MSPFRIDPYQFPNRAAIKFTTSAEMPNLIYQACLATGVVSNTVYCQHAVAEALARDLGVPLQPLLDALPPPRGPAKHLYDRDGHTRNTRVDLFHDAIGPAGTTETVK